MTRRPTRGYQRLVFGVAVLLVAVSCSSAKAEPSDPAALIDEWPGLDVEMEMALLEGVEFPDPEMLGECVVASGSSYAPLSDQFARAQSWYVVEAGEWTFSLDSAVQDLSEDELSGRMGIPLNGLPGKVAPPELESSDVSSFVSILTRAAGESLRGAAIYVPVLEIGDSQIIESWVVSVRPDGDVAFVGNCASFYWANWEAFVDHQADAGRAASAADLVRGLTDRESQTEVLAEWQAFNDSLGPQG